MTARGAGDGARPGLARGTSAPSSNLPRSSARLGLTLRSVLIQPRDGFVAALRTVDRRMRAGRRPAEGVAPIVLAGLGGAAAMLLWLKVGALFGVRDFAAARFRWSYLVIAALTGAVFGVAGQFLWGRAGELVARGLKGAARAPDLRLVWGASAFPQVFALFVLLPLDVAVVGPEIFASDRLDDPVATAWAAVSIALAVSLAAWSAFTFVRGTQVAAGLSAVRGAVAAVAAVTCVAVFVGAVALLSALAVGSR